MDDEDLMEASSVPCVVDAPRRDDRAGTAEMGIQADFSEEEECDSENSFTDVDHEFSKGMTDAEQTSSAITQQEQSASLVNASRSAKVMARKIVELKYFFGEDLSKNELEKLSKADVLVPPGLVINTSTIPNAGHGIFARCEIPKHEFFGPYIGKIIDSKDAQNYEDSPYIWEVKDDYGQLVHLVDGSDACQSNWLRYVNCARTSEEQNMRPVQYENNIYYMATRDIHLGEELLTYYGGKYAKKLGLEVHKMMLPNECFQCRNCGKTYSNAACLLGHLKYKCSTGEQRSIFVPQPTDHVNPFKVDIPDDIATRENEKLKKFRCPTCNKGFIRNYTLQCHMLIHTGKKDHKCETCGKAFTLAKHLQRHRLTHTGERPYKCHLCGKAFSQQGSLQAHSRTHTGIKPYKCEICGRAFALQSPLLSHMKTHNNEKAYKCATCGKAFTHRNTLVRHELIHSGTRPYSCSKCGKTFTQTNDLKRHSRIHTGIRPYKCHICGKAFTVEFTLVCHIRTHTGVRPYTCDYCDRTFTQPGARLKHVRKLHPGKPIPEPVERISIKSEILPVVNSSAR